VALVISVGVFVLLWLSAVVTVVRVSRALKSWDGSYRTYRPAADWARLLRDDAPTAARAKRLAFLFVGLCLAGIAWIGLMLVIR
jgi:hypothetical protein